MKLLARSMRRLLLWDVPEHKDEEDLEEELEEEL